MFWVAELVSGEIKKQELEESFLDLNPRDIVALTLRETMSSQGFIYDLDLNRLKIPNLDASKMGDVDDNSKMTLIYNKESQMFQFDYLSWQFLKSSLLRDQEFYMNFGFLKNALPQINDTQLQLGVYIDPDTNLLDTFEQREMTYCNNAYSDLWVKGKSSKQIQGMESTEVSQRFLSKSVLGEMEVQETLKYEYNTRSLYLDVVLKPRDFRHNAVIQIVDIEGKPRSYQVNLSPEAPSHLGTYIYIFNN